MARLQLARVLARAAQSAKAKSTYENLLTLWKSADADMPMFVEAKTEYARLR